jgi:hypothetical protein
VIGGKVAKGGCSWVKGVMALTPGAGSSNGMGLRPKRKWDKWAQWRVTSRGDGVSESMWRMGLMNQ